MKCSESGEIRKPIKDRVRFAIGLNGAIFFAKI